MKRRAYLYTASIIILSLVILQLSIIIVHFEKNSSEGITDLIALDRVHNRFSSIEFAISKIFVASGVNISKGSNFVQITEILPNFKASNFKNQMNYYKDYIENITESEVNPERYGSISPEAIDDLSLIILPYNLNYTHNPDFGSREINIYINDRVAGLSFSINTHPTAVNNFDYNYVDVTAGDTVFDVSALGYTYHGSIDPSGESFLKVGSPSGNVSISINDSIVRVTQVAQVMSVNSKINFTSNESVYVGLKDAVSVVVRGGNRNASAIIT